MTLCDCNAVITFSWDGNESHEAFLGGSSLVLRYPPSWFQHISQCISLEKEEFLFPTERLARISRGDSF